MEISNRIGHNSLYRAEAEMNQPKQIMVFWSGNPQVQTLGYISNFAESPNL